MITTDEVLIRSILEDPTVRDAYWGELRPESVIFDNAVYFYYEGVGLFPATYSGNKINVHAAIPKKNRGLMAVEAGRDLVDSLKISGWEVYAQVRKERKNVIRYVSTIGFTKINYSNGHYLYRYI